MENINENQNAAQGAGTAQEGENLQNINENVEQNLGENVLTKGDEMQNADEKTSKIHAENQDTSRSLSQNQSKKQGENHSKKSSQNQLQKSPKSTELSRKRALCKIEEFAKNLGISEADKTVLQVSCGEGGTKKITLQKGRWDAPEPWFVIDERERVHTSISISSLQNLLDSLRQLHRENFELRLEKAIYQQIPIDFNDAWVVAMDEIKKQAKGGLMEMNIDLDKLMSKVKKQHPNLFVDMEAMMRERGEIE